VQNLAFKVYMTPIGRLYAIPSDFVIGNKKRQLARMGNNAERVNERKMIFMKMINGFFAGLVALGLMASVPDSAFALGRGGGSFHYFAAGSPGGIPNGSGYRLAPTPANQAWVTNNGWLKYSAQLGQGANVPSGASGPTLHQSGTR
jgi:hypothetical protein